MASEVGSLLALHPHSSNEKGRFAAADVAFAGGHPPVRVELLESIGRGSFGVVYRGRTARHGPIAVKLAQGKLSRVADEISVMRAVTGHPNIAAFLFAALHDGVLSVGGASTATTAVAAPGGATSSDATREVTVLIAMELCRAQTLHDFLVRNAVAVHRDLLTIGYQVCAAVAAVHEAGCIHRDVKLQNFVFGEDGSLKLIDFGLASPTLAPPVGDIVAGTVSFMAPEMAFNALNRATRVSVGAPADVWSTAIVLFALITRRSAYPEVCSSDATAPSPTGVTKSMQLLPRVAAGEWAWPPGVAVDPSLKRLVESMLVPRSALRVTMDAVVRDPVWNERGRTVPPEVLAFVGFGAGAGANGGPSPAAASLSMSDKPGTTSGTSPQFSAKADLSPVTVSVSPPSFTFTPVVRTGASAAAAFGTSANADQNAASGFASAAPTATPKNLQFGLGLRGAAAHVVTPGLPSATQKADATEVKTEPKDESEAAPVQRSGAVSRRHGDEQHQQQTSIAGRTPLRDGEDSVAAIAISRSLFPTPAHERKKQTKTARDKNTVTEEAPVRGTPVAKVATAERHVSAPATPLAPPPGPQEKLPTSAASAAASSKVEAKRRDGATPTTTTPGGDVPLSSASVTTVTAVPTSVPPPRRGGGNNRAGGASAAAAEVLLTPVARVGSASAAGARASTTGGTMTASAFTRAYLKERHALERLRLLELETVRWHLWTRWEEDQAWVELAWLAGEQRKRARHPHRFVEKTSLPAGYESGLICDRCGCETIHVNRRVSFFHCACGTDLCPSCYTAFVAAATCPVCSRFYTNQSGVLRHRESRSPCQLAPFVMTAAVAAPQRDRGGGRPLAFEASAVPMTPTATTALTRRQDPSVAASTLLASTGRTLQQRAASAEAIEDLEDDAAPSVTGSVRQMVRRPMPTVAEITQAPWNPYALAANPRKRARSATSAERDAARGGGGGGGGGDGAAAAAAMHGPPSQAASANQKSAATPEEVTFLTSAEWIKYYRPAYGPPQQWVQDPNVSLLQRQQQPAPVPVAICYNIQPGRLGAIFLSPASRVHSAILSLWERSMLVVRHLSASGQDDVALLTMDEARRDFPDLTALLQQASVEDANALKMRRAPGSMAVHQGSRESQLRPGCDGDEWVYVRTMKTDDLATATVVTLSHGGVQVFGNAYELRWIDENRRFCIRGNGRCERVNVATFRDMETVDSLLWEPLLYP